MTDYEVLKDLGQFLLKGIPMVITYSVLYAGFLTFFLHRKASQIHLEKLSNKYDGFSRSNGHSFNFPEVYADCKELGSIRNSIFLSKKTREDAGGLEDTIIQLIAKKLSTPAQP